MRAVLTLGDDVDRIIRFERLEGEEGSEAVVEGDVALGVEQGGLESGQRRPRQAQVVYQILLLQQVSLLVPAFR